MSRLRQPKEYRRKEGRCMIALTMKGPWKALRSFHWLPMDIGGHVPLLLDMLFTFSHFLKLLQ